MSESLTIERSTPPPMIDTDELFDITLHEYQLKAYNSKKRIVTLISGIQGGKTMVGSLWMAKKIAELDGPQQNFIIACPNYKLMEKSVLPRFLHIMKGCGHFNKARYRFHLNGGGTVIFGSMTSDESLEGATNVRAILVDEAGLLRYKSWINIYARSSFKQCQVFLVTTPYSLNWLYKDIYMPWKTGTRKDIEVVQFRSVDNPYFPKEEYEAQKRNLDPRIFAMKYCGTFTKMAGLVYPDFDHDNEIEPFKLDIDKYYICGGVDLGFTNPFAVSIRAIRYDGLYDYQLGEIYQKYTDPVKRTEILKQLKQKYKIEQFFVDSEDPAQIAMFQAAGLPACPVKKGPDSIQYGISLHSSLIRKKIYKVFKGCCPNTVDEYETYAFPEVNDEDVEVVKEKPVPLFNHLMDANRYVTIMTQWIYQAAEEAAKFTFAKTRRQLLIEGDKEEDWYNS